MVTPSDALLTTTRNHPQDVQGRPVCIQVDDERWEILRFGNTLTPPFVPGPHRIKPHVASLRVRLDRQPPIARPMTPAPAGSAR